MTDDTFSSKDFDALLDDFINKQLAETEELLADNMDASDTKPSLAPSEDVIQAQFNSSKNNDDTDEIFSNIEDDEIMQLAEEEKRLYNAYSEFIKSTSYCAEEHQVAIPDFYFSPSELLPRFSPRRTDNLKKDIATCWDILIQTENNNLSKLPFNASDEQILDFAEKISIPNLQLSLISYVETLIETDSCETAYNIRKVKYQKHKIEKELYEEHQRILNRKRLYAQAIREKNFPIDADLLVNNFFKTANKDPQGAKELLENNPATFAPIQVDKIPDRFFGLIKASPADGKTVNKKLGKFLAKLEV